MKIARHSLAILSAFVLMAAWTVSPASAEGDPAFDKIVKHAENRPLDSLARAADEARNRGRRPGPPREVINFRHGVAAPVDGGTTAPETIQDTQGNGPTTFLSGFHGTSNNDNGDILGFLVAPPDTDGAVGPNHFVQMINLLTTIFDKAGNVVSAPFASNAFWAGIGGNCEPYNQGDPIVVYDDAADRWLVSQFAFPDSFNSFSQCVAISQTGDPTGAYNRYEFSFDDYGFNDYPKHGIVSDSITMIANLFQARGPFFRFAGTFLGVMDKNAMYAGDPATLIGFDIGSNEFGFVAGDLDGGGSSPALFATAMSNSGSFDIWQIDVDWATANANANRIAQVGISGYDADLCGASREACIPQPDGAPALEAISDRLMHRLQIRDFGSHKTMVTGHTVDVGNGRAGIRWYEMRDSGSGWSLHQEGTFAPNDGQYRWMPSVAMNGAGDIGIGYMIASTNTYVSTAVAGQSASASGTGQLDSDELICAAGTGVQNDTARSGDYSATSIDPINDTFWHTNEVFTQSGQFQWNTFVCEFEVAAGSGNSPPVASFTYDCPDLTCSFDGSASSDSDGSIVSYEWDFGDGTTGSGETTAHTYGGAGTYTVVLTVTDDLDATGSDSQDVTVDDGVNNPPVASFTYDCPDLTCSFDGSASSDSDGSIVSYEWDFGDGTTGSGETTAHTYGGAGTYTVVLTVTDDLGATGSDSQDVTVDEPPAISLSASGYKVRGRHTIDLSWSGATSTNVDVYRDGVVIATTANDGAYTDSTNNRGSATYVYQVCEAGTSTCSNTATVSF